MKWRSLLFLFTCLQQLRSMQTAGRTISAKNNLAGIDFTCHGGTWENSNDNLLSLLYKDEASGVYKCTDKNNNNNYYYMTVRIRTCENCIELDAPALSAIIIGNLLATFVIACAVYSITSQPKSKNFSGNKASDKVNLITNGDRDTYQQLTGPSSEYSRLERKK